MKIDHLFVVFAFVLAFSGVSGAQHVRVFSGIDHLPSGDPDVVDTITISFTGLEEPGVRFLIATVPAATREACLASRDFSSAVPVGPETAFSTYDPQTNKTIHTWYLKSANSPGTPGCQVLLSRGGTVDALDYNIWRANFGRTASASEQDPEKQGDEPVRAQKTRVTSITLTFDNVVVQPVSY